MKKIVFIISFVILSVIFSYSCVFAENAGEQVVNGIQDTANGVKNGAKDAVNSTAGAVKNGAENVKETTQDATNGAKNGLENAGENIKNTAENAGNDAMNTMDNAGDNMRNGNDNAYTAERTATESPTTNNNNQGWMNRDMWTWIVVGVITLVIIALIWYYASRNTH